MTTKEHNKNPIDREQEPDMLNEIKAAYTRSRATIWQDILGGTALMVSLVGVLHLPGLF